MVAGRVFKREGDKKEAVSAFFYGRGRLKTVCVPDHDGDCCVLLVAINCGSTPYLLPCSCFCIHVARSDY